MKNEIIIGSVKMPLADFVISRNAILGITKSGKTYTAKGVAEQLLDRGIPIIVFDAIGVWRFLKTAGDGKDSKAYNIVVAGGEAPDLPLTPSSAPEIVRAAIRENIPLVIDLYDSKLSKADWRRIVQSCCRVLLYENKGLRHVFLEEAAEYAPQRVTDGETYAEVEKLARMGGNKQIGITFINQRAQELNKAVLELCDNVILLRQRGSHAIDSLEKWLDRLSPDMSKEIADSMPQMTQGDCWIFTENGSDEPVRTKSGLIRSFHPDRRMDQAAITSRKSANPGEFVKTLSGQLEKLFTEQKANDPLTLKKRIYELERELKEVVSKRQVSEVKVSVLEAEDRSRLDNIIGFLIDEVKRWQDCMNQVIEFRKDVEEMSNRMTMKSRVSASESLEREIEGVRFAVATPKRITWEKSLDTKLGRCERAILSALAQYPHGRTVNQIGILAGYSIGSGGFNNSLSTLRSQEYITRGNPIQITKAGIDALGDYTPLPTAEGLQNFWLNKLGKCESAILSFLLKVYPRTATSDVVAQSTNYAPSSGGFNNSLSKLRTLELITRGQPMKASDDFFQ